MSSYVYLQDPGGFESSLQVKVVPGLPEENLTITPPPITVTFLAISQGGPVYIHTYVYTYNVDKCDIYYDKKIKNLKGK